MAAIATQSPLLTELAAVLAKGFLRLAHDAHKLGTFGPREPQKELEPSPRESPHCGQESEQEGPPWKPA